MSSRTIGGEGRTRTFEAARATDLQSAAFDRFATSPIVVLNVSLDAYPAEKLSNGAGGRIRTPDLLITNQLLYQTELRQPDKSWTIALPMPRRNTLTIKNFADVGKGGTPIPAELNRESDPSMAGPL